MKCFTNQRIARGNLGEQLVREVLARLPTHYRTFNDLIVPLRAGSSETTQIDHVVTCEFGCFVIETKKFEGSIYGQDNDRHWFQILGSQHFRFANPLRQNGHHVAVLCRHLGLRQEVFHPVVVFVGLAMLAPGLPQNVISTIAVGTPDLRRYIESFFQPLIEPSQLVAINQKLTRLQQLGLTLDDHLRSLHSRDLQRRLEWMIKLGRSVSSGGISKYNHRSCANNHASVD